MSCTAFDRFVALRQFRATIPPSHHAQVCDLGCGLASQFLQDFDGRIRLGVDGRAPIDAAVDRPGADVHATFELALNNLRAAHEPA